MSVAVFVVVPRVAETVADCCAVTAVLEAVKVAVAAPAGNVTVDGTETAE